MTYEEFQAGLAETPELLGTVLEKHEADAIKHLTEGKKMVVTTMADYTKDRQKAIDDTTKKNHGDWEAKLATIMGETRPEGVNGLTWLDQLVEKKALIKASQTGDPNSPENKAKDTAIQDLQNQIKDLKKGLDDEKKGTFNAKVSAQITSGIGALKFRVPADIKDDAQKTAYQRDQVAATKALFGSLYTPEAMTDGKVLYKDAKGTPQVDENGDPLSVEGIFAKNHAHLLTPTTRSAGGTGSADDQPQNSSADYLGATTEEIRAKLSEQMIAMGTDKWAELYKKAHIAAGYKYVDGMYRK